MRGENLDALLELVGALVRSLGRLGVFPRVIAADKRLGDGGCAPRRGGSGRRSEPQVSLGNIRAFPRLGELVLRLLELRRELLRAVVGAAAVLELRAGRVAGPDRPRRVGLHSLHQLLLQRLDRLLELREPLVLLRHLRLEPRDERLHHAGRTLRLFAVNLLEHSRDFTLLNLGALGELSLRRLVPRALLLVLHGERLDHALALSQQSHEFRDGLAGEGLGVRAAPAAGPRAKVQRFLHGLDLPLVLLEQQLVELLDRLAVLRLLLERIRAQVSHRRLRAGQRGVLLAHQLLQTRDGALRHRGDLRDGGLLAEGTRRADAAAVEAPRGRRDVRLQPPAQRVALVLGVFSRSLRVGNLPLKRRALALSLGGSDLERADRLDLLQDHALGLDGRGAGLDAHGGGGADGGERLRVGPASRRGDVVR